MKLSAKTEYACLAMLELARHAASSEPVRAADIAERHGIPVRFLVQILLQLKASGLLRSTRGAAGGYHLGGAPEETTLADVMAAVEGAPSEVESSVKSSPATKALGEVWRQVAKAQREILEKVTLADLVERAERSGEKMYYI